MYDLNEQMGIVWLMLWLQKHEKDVAVEMCRKLNRLCTHHTYLLVVKPRMTIRRRCGRCDAAFWWAG